MKNMIFPIVIALLIFIFFVGPLYFHSRNFHLKCHQSIEYPDCQLTVTLFSITVQKIEKDFLIKSQSTRGILYLTFQNSKASLPGLGVDLNQIDNLILKKIETLEIIHNPYSFWINWILIFGPLILIPAYSLQHYHKTRPRIRF